VTPLSLARIWKPFVKLFLKALQPESLNASANAESSPIQSDLSQRFTANKEWERVRIWESVMGEIVRTISVVF
jgi:hypothetical protein